MFLSSGDRVLRVAFKIHLGSQASSQVQAKNSTLLSSCNGYLLEPIECPKRSQASCGVLRVNSGLLSRPCRKRRASSHDDGGILWVFFRAVAGVWGSHMLRQGTQGASRVVPGKSSLHLSFEGECGIALESWKWNRALRCIEEGISRSFSSCGRKPSVPFTCAMTSGSFSGCL